MPYILIAAGIIGFICSFALSRDAIQFTKNGTLAPSCGLHTFLHCGNIAQFTQASIFGLPDAWLGLIAFAIFTTVGVGMLAGAKFKWWFWAMFEGSMALSFGYTYWLVFATVRHAHVLCSLCLTIGVVITTVFWYLSLYVIREQHLPIPKQLIGTADFARKYHLPILVAWLVLVALLISRQA